MFVYCFQKRNEERKKQTESENDLEEESYHETNTLETETGSEEKSPEATDGSVAKQDGIRAVYNHMMQAIEHDDVMKLKMLTDNIRKQGILLGDESLCADGTKETVLHSALSLGKRECAKSLIEHGTVDFLTQDYEVIVKNHPSQKSTLHLLTELGHLDLIQLLLSSILPLDRRTTYLSKSVLMEISGQRPRHLEAIHIAALNGHTDIVEYFVSLGIDVNAVNNKNDTPVLWAARNNHIDTVRKLIMLGKNYSLC